MPPEEAAAAAIALVVAAAAAELKTLSPRWAPQGGAARVWECYEAHLPSLSLRYRENSRSIMAGEVLPTLHSHVLCKNWHLFRVCWEGYERKNLHAPKPP